MLLKTPKVFFLFLFYPPWQTTIITVWIAWLFVCLCLYTGIAESQGTQWAACNDFTVSHYFCACDVPNRNSFSCFSFFFFSHTYTLTEDLTQSECPGRPSQLDTPEQWCFPFGAGGMGYISLTDSVHSPCCSPFLLSLYQPLSLSLFLSISVKLDLSFSLAVCCPSSIHYFWRIPPIWDL